jgi:hypothetical protein
MIEFLRLVGHIVVSPFKTRTRLEAEIILLRHQLNVLRRRVPVKPKLTAADRLIFVWLYRLFPSVRKASEIWRAIQSAVGLAVTLIQTRWRRSRRMITNP